MHRYEATFEIDLESKVPTAGESVTIPSLCGTNGGRWKLNWEVEADGKLFVSLGWTDFGGGVTAGLKSVRMDVNCPGVSLHSKRFELTTGGKLPTGYPGAGRRFPEWQGKGHGIQQIVVRLKVDFGPPPTPITPGYTGTHSIVRLSPLRSLTRIRRLYKLSDFEQRQIRLRIFRFLALRRRGIAQRRCPYFKTLFESGFAEGSPSTPEQGAAKSNQRAVEREYDDSDDGTDESTLSSNADSDSVASTPSSDLSFRIVNIDAAAYTTYRALLCWLQTGHIAFAPLRSSFRLQSDPIALRTAKIKTAHLKLSHPVSASPKSVYRLAHFLELPKFAKLALDNLKSQLTKENIAFEVFGDVASIYEEVRKVEVEYAVEHWELVIGSPAMAEVGRLVDELELPSFGPASLRIHRLLAEKTPVWLVVC